MALLGIVASDPTPDSGRVAWLLISVLLGSGALFIINDILDAESDRVTAPYLPLPAGLVTRRDGVVASVVVLAGALATLWIAADGIGGFAVALGLTIAAAGLSAAYSLLKDEGILGSFAIAVPQAMPVAIGWYLFGHQHAGLFAVAAAYCLLACVSNNVLAALRDVDLDPVVGNRTLPVRRGAVAGFQFAAVVAAAAVLLVVVMAVLQWPAVWALATAIAALAIMASSYGSTKRNFALPDRGRVQRMGDMRTFKLGDFVRNGAAVAAFQPLLALAVGVAYFVKQYVGNRIYAARMIRGGLSDKMR
jgi:4-hydroxybenzoate polyprenyltransferase